MRARRARFRTRRKVKQEQLTSELRHRIVVGAYTPGQRLPTQVQLLEQFKVSSVTIQRAISRLQADGFIVPRGRRGTFVADDPPHLCNYALTFESHPGEPYLHAWSRFWTALTNAADCISRATGRRISVYHDINGHADQPTYQMLLKQAHAQKLAGLIFGTPPFRLVQSPLMQLPGLPRVGIMAENHHFPQVKAVGIDMHRWIEMALDYLDSRSRRRVGFVLFEDLPPDYVEMFASALAARGMRTQPQWTQTLNPRNPVGSQQCVHLLMHRGQAERPDGLIVADDHLVESVERGLVEAGIRVPEEVEVVALANWPDDQRTVLPLKRLGMDCRQLLWRCIENIDRQRQGQNVPEITEIPPIFEDQVPREIRFTNNDLNPASAMPADPLEAGRHGSYPLASSGG